LNALVGENRTIVSRISGTTHDAIEYIKIDITFIFICDLMKLVKCAKEVQIGFMMSLKYHIIIYLIKLKQKYTFTRLILTTKKRCNLILSLSNIVTIEILEQ